jgi:hypothetical protein
MEGQFPDELTDGSVLAANDSNLFAQAERWFEEPAHDRLG